MSNWRLTFFGDDDETPLVGAVAAGGVVTEASCSTDPAHPRPYLLVPESLAESEVDLAEGRSVIGQANVTVLDKRTVAADQATGWLTALLPVYGTGEAAGQSALNGRRALLEQTDDGATWFRVMDGVIGGVKLNDSLVTYSFEIRDIRERERKVRAFVRSDTTALLPRGVIGGYGLHRGKTLAPRVTPLTGKFKRNSDHPLQGYVDISGWSGGGLIRKAKPEMVVTKQMREVFKPEQKLVVRAGPLKQYENTYGRVRILWRAKNTSNPWKEIRAPIARQWGERGLIRTRIARIEGPGDEEDRIAPAVWRVIFGGRATTDLPANNQEVELIVGYNGPPSEEFPLHLDGMTAGELLKRLYDGEYCEAPDLPGTELRIRYDAAAVLSLATPVRARISEPVDDLREWVQEHIYKPLGAAPALDEYGRVKPIRYALPPADVELTQLNDANTAAGAGWEHPLSDAVNHVIVRYHRDYRVPTDQDPEGEASAGDGLASMEVVVERLDAASVYAIGDKPMEIELNLFRSSGGVQGDAVSGDVSDEIGHALALERADQALDRFAYGGQTIMARCRRTATGHLRAGDWVLVALSWLPDYQTGRRGTSRLAQVTAVKDVDPAWRELTLVDAGPSNQPLPLPVLGTPTATAEGIVSVPVTSVPADAFVRVQYAVLAPDRAEPLPGDWRALDRMKRPTLVGEVAVAETPPLPAGATVWVRARAEGKQRRPSAWTNAAVLTLPRTPRVGEVRVEISRATRQATVFWVANAFAAGVRIRYAEHDRDAEEPALSAWVDAAAAAGAKTLPLVVGAGKSITVEVEPRDTWDGAVASGGAGLPVRATAYLPAADAGRVRLNVEASDTGGTGTITLTVTDTESLVASVAFVVTDGAGARTTVVGSPVSPGVYRHSVALHPEHNVAIEPVVTLTDGSTLKPGSETFDRDHSANLVGRPQVAYDGAQATVTVTADSDTVSLHAQEWNGTAWVKPAELAQERFATDRRGSFTVTASTAATRRLRVFGRNAAGTDGPAEEVQIARHRQPSPVTALAWMEVISDSPTADLNLRVEGPQAAFPVRAEIHLDDPSGPALVVNGAGATSITFTAPGQSTNLTAYPGLVGIVLPRTGMRRVWVKLTDAQNNPPVWAFTSADRDRLPGGAVTPDDYRANPALIVTYDEDVDSLFLEVPWPGGARKGLEVYGLSGGGTLTYRVGVDTLSDGTKEAPFAVDEGPERGAYQVWLGTGAGTSMVQVFSGPLHGQVSRPPVAEPTVTLDLLLRDRVDISVKLASPTGEQVGLELKDSDAPAAPVWTYVGTGTKTAAYVASGGVVAETADFAVLATPATANARKLDNLPLVRDQVARLWVRPVGKDSRVPGAWTPVVLQVKEQPWLESVDLLFDETSDDLLMTVVGGAFCRSARLELSESPSFATLLASSQVALADGGRASLLLDAAALRNRAVYARATPYNGPLVDSNADGTADAVSGLAGQPQQDTEFVPASEEGTRPPTAVIELAVAEPGYETLTLNGALGAGGLAYSPTVPLQWRTRLDDARTGIGTWSTWSSAALPATRQVIRGARWDKVLRLEVRDAASRVGRDAHRVASRMEAITEGGVVDTGIPHGGGHHIFRRGADYANDVLEQTGKWFTHNSMLDNARNIVNVFRGAANRPVGDLFDKTSDGMDQIGEGTTHGKVVRSVLSGGKVFSLLRGTGDVNASTLFHKDSETLDHVGEGSSFGKVVKSVLNVGRVFNLRRGASDVDTGTLFHKDSETLDQVGEGTTHGKVVRSVLSAGRVFSLRRGVSDVDTGTLFHKDTEGLDQVGEGTTHGKVVRAVLSAGRIFNLRRGGTDIDAGTLFHKTSETLDHVGEGTTYGKVARSTLSGSKVAWLTRGGSDVPSSEFFRAGHDTLDHVIDSGTWRRTTLAEADQTRYATQNLLGPDAATAAAGGVMRTVTLAEAGLAPGNVVSASGEIQGSVLTDRWRLEVRFYNASNALVSERGSTEYSGTAYERRVVENAVIPAGTVRIDVATDNQATTTGTRTLRNVMLNRGPLALPFEEPPFRARRETLDHVAEGTTHGKVVRSVLSGGRIFNLRRGATDVDTGTLFHKDSETLDQVGEGTSFGKVVRGVLNAGRIFNLRRGAADVDTGTLFHKDSEGLDQIAEGTTHGKVVRSVLSAGRVFNLRRGVADVDTGTLFHKDSETLDHVGEGSSFGKVVKSVLNVGRVFNLRRGATDVDTGTLFHKDTEGLDQIAEGTTHGKVVKSVLSAGRVFNLRRGATDIDAGTLFHKSSETLDHIGEGTTYGKVARASLSSGKVSFVTRGGADVPTDNLFQIGTDGVAQVAGAESVEGARIQALSVFPGQLHKNPLFARWTGAHPEGWSAGIGAASKETALTRSGGYGVRFTPTSAGDSRYIRLNDTSAAGMVQGLNNPEYLVLEVDVMYVSGSAQGSGVLVDWVNTVGGGYRNQNDVHLGDDLGDTPTLNVWHTVRKVLRRPATFTGTFRGIQLYLMGNWTSFPGGGAVKDVVFDRLTLREATLQEINTFLGLNGAGRLVTGLENGADVGGVAARLVAKQGQGIFLEEFKTLPSDWGGVGSTTTTPTLEAGVGVTGGNAIRVSRGNWGAVFPNDLPFDPSKLYRLRARVRHLDDPGYVDLFTGDTIAAGNWDAGGDAAATWTIATAAPGVLTAEGGTQATLLRKTLSAADVHVIAEVTEAYNGGLVARWQDNGNYYLLAIRDDSGGTPTQNLELFKRVGGAFTILGSADVAWTRGTKATVELEVIGSTLRALFNGTQVIGPVTDTAITAAGRVGLRNTGTTGNFFRVDRFETQVSGAAAAVVGTRYFYFGVRAVGATGNTIGTYYIAANAVQPAVGAGWLEYTGWLRGNGTIRQPANDPLLPSGVPATTRYIRPYLLVNWLTQSNGTQEVDYLSIDVLDEDQAERTYRAVAPGGANIHEIPWRRGGTNELPTSLFKRMTDAASDVVESTGRWFTNNTMLDGARNIVNVFRGGAGKGVGDLFDKVSEGLDQIGEGATYGKVVKSTLASGRVANVRRGAGDVPVTELFRAGYDTLDMVVDGTTYARTTLGEKTGAGHAASHLDSTGVRSTASIAGTAATLVRESAYRTGNNLVSNGGAESGTNLNFSPLTAVASTSARSGSYVFRRTGPVTFGCDEYIPVDPARQYVLGLSARAVSPAGTRLYSAVFCYDQDKNFIQTHEVYAPGLIYGTLAQPAAAGATSVVLTDASQFPAPDGNTFVAFGARTDLADLPNRTVRAYTGKTGNTLSGLSALSVAYPAGTVVRFHRSGSTYNYVGAVWAQLGTGWSDFSGTIQGIPAGGGYSETAFRPGTRYVKVGLLANYGGAAGDVQEFDGFSFGEVSFVESATGVVNAVEGRRRLDSFYKADKRLLPTVTWERDGVDELPTVLFKKGNDSATQVVESTGRWFTNNTMLDGSRNVVNVYRGTANKAVTDLFDKASEGLDQVAEGTTYGKVAKSSLTSGKVSTVYRGGDVPTTSLFRKDTEGLDQVAEGTTYGKVAKTTLTGGKVSTVYRAGDVATTSLFNKDTEGLDQVAEGTTYGKVARASLTGGKVSTVYRGGDVATTSLFNKDTETADFIAEGATRKFAAESGADRTGNNLARGALVADTRWTNNGPASYPMGTTHEFKYRSVIGAPGGADFGGLETVKPWSDSSGGHATQTFRSSDGVYKRAGWAGDSAWGPWREVFDQQNLPDEVERWGVRVVTTSLFNKDTETVDSIAESASRKFASDAEKQGGGRAYAALNGSGQLVTAVVGTATVDGQYASTLRTNASDARLRTGLGGNHLQTMGGMNLRSWDPDLSYSTGVCIAWNAFQVKSSGDVVDVPGGSFSGVTGSGSTTSTYRYYSAWYDRATGQVGIELVQYGSTTYSAAAASTLGYDRMVVGTIKAAQDVYGSYGGGTDPGTGDDGGGTITPYRKAELAEPI